MDYQRHHSFDRWYIASFVLCGDQYRFAFQAEKLQA
jgi:hypothetical protein